jgi:hypothetical protein
MQEDAMSLDKDEKEHLTALLRHNKRRLQVLEKRQALWGLECPPHIVLEIETIVEKIIQLEGVLDSLGGDSLAAYISTNDKFSKDKTLIFDNQEEIYHYLWSYVAEHGANNAVLVQYSGRRAIPLLWMLLQKGAHVIMYVQKPKKAISQRQKHRIKSNVIEMDDEIKINGDGSLKVYFYDTPASFRGVIIDDKILSIGNYLYEYCNDKLFPDDKMAISGHDVPGLLLHEGSRWYDIYSKMFYDMVANYNQDIKSNKRKPVLNLPRKKKSR